MTIARECIEIALARYIFRLVGRITGALQWTPLCMLRPTEAAVVASVALRDVNRAIDEHILPEGFVSHDDGRRVAFTACMLISFYFESAERLTAKERTCTIHEAGLRLLKFRKFDLEFMVEHDWTVRHDFVTIDLAPFVRRTKERMELLTAAREAVVSDPEILGGTPVLRGTPCQPTTSRLLLKLASRRTGSSRPIRRLPRNGSSSRRSMRRRILRGGVRDRPKNLPPPA